MRWAVALAIICCGSVALAKPNEVARPRVLSYPELMGLPSAQRVAYLRGLADVLAQMERAQRTVDDRDYASASELQDNIALLIQYLDPLSAAAARPEGEVKTTTPSAPSRPFDPSNREGVPLPEKPKAAEVNSCAQFHCTRLEGEAFEAARQKFRSAKGSQLCIVAGHIRQAVQGPTRRYCRIPRTSSETDINVTGQSNPIACRRGEALCNMALFCVESERSITAQGQSGRVPFPICVSTKGMAITQACSDSYDKIVREKTMMVSLTGKEARRSQVRACDIASFDNMFFAEKMRELLQSTQSQFDQMCNADEQITGLFCNECTVIAKRLAGLGGCGTKPPLEVPEVKPPPNTNSDAVRDGRSFGH